jgi:hypothetical protein
MNGAYVVYCKSDRPLSIDGRRVAPGEPLAWLSGAALRLGPTTTLRLDVGEDTAPSRRPRRLALPDEIAELDFGDAAPEAAAPRGSGKALCQIAVIVACVAGCVGLLFNDSPSPPAQASTVPAERDVREVFNGLVQALLEEEARDESDAREIRAELQTAQVAELYDVQEAARQAYVRIREIVEPRGDDGDFGSELNQKVWNFVISRLRP